MYCGSCGAKLTEKDARCPFCGTINPLGAEAEYMEKLEDIREDTEDLADTTREEYGKQLKHHSGFAIKIFLVLFFICLFFFFLTHGCSHLIEQHEKKELRDEIAFRNEYFPRLDELYSQGDDEIVMEYMDSLFNKKGVSALYSWKHQTYYQYYGYYQNVRNLIDGIKYQDYSDYELYEGFYCALLLTQDVIQSYDRQAISAQEKDKIEAFAQEAYQLLTADLGFAPDELQGIYDECCEDEFLEYSLCKKYIKEARP